MDLSDRIALVYAEDLMKFVMRHHNINWWESSLGSDAFEKEAKGHFPFEMGVVVVGFAKSIMKEWMHRTREFVLRSAREGLESYIRRFVAMYFDQCEHSPTNTIRLMTYIVEASVFLYLNNVEDAPLQGIRLISRLIQDEVPNRADMLVALEHLHQWAISLINDPRYRIPESFASGTFYGGGK